MPNLASLAGSLRLQGDPRDLTCPQWVTKELVFNKFRVLYFVMYQDALKEYPGRKTMKKILYPLRFWDGMRQVKVWPRNGDQGPAENTGGGGEGDLDGCVLAIKARPLPGTSLKRCVVVLRTCRIFQCLGT